MSVSTAGRKTARRPGCAVVPSGLRPLVPLLRCLPSPLWHRAATCPRVSLGRHQATIGFMHTIGYGIQNTLFILLRELECQLAHKKHIKAITNNNKNKQTKQSKQTTIKIATMCKCLQYQSKKMYVCVCHSIVITVMFSLIHTNTHALTHTHPHPPTHPPHTHSFFSPFSLSPSLSNSPSLTPLSHSFSISVPRSLPPHSASLRILSLIHI